MMIAPAVVHALDDGRVAHGRRRADEHFRASQRCHAGLVEQVFYRQWNASEGGQLHAGLTLRVDAIGGCASRLPVDEKERARTFALRIVDRGE
jgi:hypothetical protein